MNRRNGATRYSFTTENQTDILKKSNGQKKTKNNSPCNTSHDHSTIVLKGLRAALNWSPMMPRGLIHKEGHADRPPSEMTPSKTDCEWCTMF